MEPIIVRGGGDIATGSIYRLCKAGYPVIVLEVPQPSTIRRYVSFGEAVYDGEMRVEDMTAHRCFSFEGAWECAMKGYPSIFVDPEASCLKEYHPWFLVDAILAKKNMGTTRDMADVTVGLGPGFTAGKDVDYVVETMRGHKLGRIISEGSAIPDTGVPGTIMGYGAERVMHSPASGVIRSGRDIGDSVVEGETIALIRTEEGDDVPVTASLTGVLRGLITEGYEVTKGLKIADIDPRRVEKENCLTISDKARCIAGSVLELAVRAEHGLL